MLVDPRRVGKGLDRRRRVGESLVLLLIVLLGPFFLHHHTVSHVVVLHPGHEASHEHQAPSTGGFDVGRVGRVGDGGGVEPFAFVGDFDADDFRAHAAGDVDVLARVKLVPVADGVDQGLFHGQVDAEDVVLDPIVLLELFEDFLQEGRAGSCLTWNHAFALPDPAIL